LIILSDEEEPPRSLVRFIPYWIRQKRATLADFFDALDEWFNSRDKVEQFLILAFAAILLGTVALGTLSLVARLIGHLLA
jgi:hypothetical protein